MEENAWKIARQYFNCLPKPNVSAAKILMVKIALLGPFLLVLYISDNIVQIERLFYAKICGERRLFHDFINICPGKSKNLKPQGSLRTLLFLFSFQKQPSRIILESSCSKISQNTRGGFLFYLQSIDHHI